MSPASNTVAGSLRPLLLSVFQSVQAGICVVAAWMLLMRNEQAVLTGQVAPIQVEHDLRFGAASCIAVAIPSLIAASGMWRNQPWAYRLTVLVTVAGVVLPLGGLFGPSPNWRVLWIVLPFVAQLVFALHTETRKQLRRLWESR